MRHIDIIIIKNIGCIIKVSVSQFPCTICEAGPILLVANKLTPKWSSKSETRPQPGQFILSFGANLLTKNAGNRPFLELNFQNFHAEHSLRPPRYAVHPAVLQPWHISAHVLALS